MLIKSKTNKSFCKGCGREIIWGRLHPSEEPRPFDSPLKISITIREGGEEIFEVGSEQLHFRTCTKRDKFRKSQEPAAKAPEKKSQQISLF